MSEIQDTNLALNYINELTKSSDSEDIDPEVAKDLRNKLRILLLESNSYKTSLVLKKTIESELHFESALLYGKLGDHEMALNIYVQQLHDHQMARNYCLQLCHDQQDLTLRHRLFHTLLTIYLNSCQRECGSVSPSLRPDLRPALELLNSETNEFDSIRVLQVIPQQWILSSVHQFLNRAIRQTIHDLRQSLVSKGLANTENRSVRYERLSTQRQSLLLNEQSRCSVCRTTISEPQFQWFPSLNLLLHPHCAKGLAITSNSFNK